MKENIIMYIGFLFLGIVIYLDYGKQIWGDVTTTESEARLAFYGIGCAILIIGLIYKKIKSAGSRI